MLYWQLSCWKPWHCALNCYTPLLSMMRSGDIMRRQAGMPPMPCSRAEGAISIEGDNDDIISISDDDSFSSDCGACSQQQSFILVGSDDQDVDFNSNTPSVARAKPQCGQQTMCSDGAAGGSSRTAAASSHASA